MEDLDLNINNYNYKDILNLFKINTNFGENELKNAKKKLLNLHPDKSGLDKKYFLFFSSAYKILFKIYEFREKAKISENKNLEYENTNYIFEEDIYNKEIINNLRESNNLNPKNFNKWFNNLFEQVKITSEFEESGYGNWLKSNENVENYKINNTNELNQIIEQKKEILRNNSIVSHKTINEYNNNNFCDLTNSGVENYSSGLFSSLQYEDLKKAHTETVVPVTNSDFKPSCKNYDELNKLRKNNDLVKPLSEKESLEYINNNKNNENILNSQRAFKLIKQQENIDDANKKWWSSLKQLK